FDATTGCSAPVPRFSTLALAVGAACGFSLHVVGRDEAQVLTFRTKAWSSFAPPTCRMPLGQYQGIPRADPGGRVTPRFRLHGWQGEETKKHYAFSLRNLISPGSSSTRESDCGGHRLTPANAM